MNTILKIVCYATLLSAILTCGATASTDASTQPSPERINRIVVSLADQAFATFLDDQFVFRGPISSGTTGYETRTGTYRVTDKHRHWVSTIYDVPMTFFLRFNGSALGMHEGLLPGFPASHGCIRTQRTDAERIFAAAPIGTIVIVQTESTPETYGVPQPPPIIRYYKMVNGKKVFLKDDEVEAYKGRKNRNTSQGTKNR